MQLFLCPIDPVQCAASELLLKWAKTGKAPKTVLVLNESGMTTMSTKDLQREVDHLHVGQFKQTRFILIGEGFRYPALPTDMTWHAASTLVSSAAQGSAVELCSWGYDEARCLMLYGDWQMAETLGLPLQNWSSRPMSHSSAFDSAIGGVGGWDVEVLPLSALIANLPGPKELVTFSGNVDRTDELLGYPLARRTILESQRDARHPLPPAVGTVVFHSLADRELESVMQEARDNSSYRFTIFPALESGHIRDDQALELLLYNSNDFLADRLLDRFRWFITVNSFDDSAFQLSLHTLPSDLELIESRRQLADVLGNERCIVW